MLKYHYPMSVVLVAAVLLATTAPAVARDWQSVFKSGEHSMDTNNELSSILDKYVKPAIDQYKSSDWGNKWNQQPASGSEPVTDQPSTPDDTDNTVPTKSAPWSGDVQSALSDLFKKGWSGSDTTDSGHDGHDSTDTGSTGSEPGNTGSDDTNSDSTGSDNTDGSSSSGGDSASSDMQAVLDLHNKYRARHGVPALSWSDSIASKAQAYSRGCVMRHSGASGLGENLAMGQRSFTAAVTDWYSEANGYSYGGSIQGAGHFTQIVWKSTTQLGCGMSSCGGRPLYVCNYSPPGNYVNNVRNNVFPPSS